MRRFSLMTVTLLAAAAVALAQTGAAYVGEVTGQNVYVRSGPDRNHYPVTQLSAPARVTVVGSEGEWLKIEPPEGAFSLISKRYVQREGDFGTVTADVVQVRAGSLLQPTKADYVQGQFRRGARVGILGETEEYYKIKPEGAVLYIRADYVRPAGGPPAAASRPAIPASRPAEDAAGLPGLTVRQRPAQPTLVRRTTVTTTLPAGFAGSGPAGAAKAAYDALEEALQNEYTKPAAQRDYAGLLAAYQAIELDADSEVLKPAIEYRVKYLLWELKRAADTAAINEMTEDAARRHQDLDREIQRLREAQSNRKPGDPPPPITVTKEGRLVASTLFTGRGFYPKRWTLRVQNTGVILAYLEQTGKVRLADHEGWKVRIVGRPRYSAALKTDIIDVVSVERLPGGAPAVAPPVATSLPVAPPVVEPPADWSFTPPAPAESQPVKPEEFN